MPPVGHHSATKHDRTLSSSHFIHVSWAYSRLRVGFKTRFLLYSFWASPTVPSNDSHHSRAPAVWKAPCSVPFPLARLLNGNARRLHERNNDRDDISNSTGGPIDSLAMQAKTGKGRHGTPLFVMEGGGRDCHPLGAAARETHKTVRACSDWHFVPLVAGRGAKLPSDNGHCVSLGRCAPWERVPVRRFIGAAGDASW